MRPANPLFLLDIVLGRHYEQFSMVYHLQIYLHDVAIDTLVILPYPPYCCGCPKFPSEIKGTRLGGQTTSSQYDNYNVEQTITMLSIQEY